MTFEEYMSGNDGRGLDQVSTLGTDKPNEYLRNRLFWAFEAGVKSGDYDRRLQQTIELERRIAEAQHSIYWNKKRIKVVEGQIATLPTEQTQAEAAQEISEGMGKS